jgi:UDP-glucose 4-epimerase
VRDYLYVGDAAQAALAAARFQGEPRIFNLGAGQGVSLNELVAEIRKLLGRAVEVRYGPGRAVDVPANVLDVSAARRHLGWSASTPLAEGLRLTSEWLRSAQ